mgnify:FL=1
MSLLHVVQNESRESEGSRRWSCGAMRALLWVVGIVILFVLGSWLVWLSSYLQRTYVEEDIRTACQRVMPDTVQRCIDTVVIQRGGARR